MSLWLEDNGLTEEALDMVAAEDIAQREKWGVQRHSVYKWCSIAHEEAGEVNKAALEGDLDALEKEAVQAATVYLKIAYMARKKGVSEVFDPRYRSESDDMIGAKTTEEVTDE